MGQYDKQIKEAQKIGDGWIKKTSDYRSQFEVLKKNNIKWEKDTITGLQKDIDKGEHNDPAKAKGMLAEIETSRDFMKQFEAEAKRLYDEHEKWALSEPRKSMAPIDKKLKLGGVGAEAYEAVADATKRQLTDVATEIANTQRAYKDIETVIENQVSRLDAIESIVNKDAGKAQAYMAQIRKMAASFEASCKDAWINFKLQGDALAKLRSGAYDTWTDKQIVQQHQLYQKKRDLVPQVMAALEKNHNRVLKSVPKQFIDGFMTSAEKRKMETVKTEYVNKFKAAQTFCDRMATEIEGYQPFRDRGVFG